MLKKLLLLCAFMLAASTVAAVDVNQATEAELDGIRGFGPGTTRTILAERDKGEFKDWSDFIKRVKGIGAKSAVKYSAQGLTISGRSYTSTEYSDTRDGQVGK